MVVPNSGRILKRGAVAGFERSKVTMTIVFSCFENNVQLRVTVILGGETIAVRMGILMKV